MTDRTTLKTQLVDAIKLNGPFRARICPRRALYRIVDNCVEDFDDIKAGNAQQLRQRTRADLRRKEKAGFIISIVISAAISAVIGFFIKLWLDRRFVKQEAGPNRIALHLLEQLVEV